MKKRILAIVLSIVMILGSVSFSAFATDPGSYASQMSDSAHYLIKLPQDNKLDTQYQWISSDAPIPISEVNGEKFLTFNEENFPSKFAKQDTYYIDLKLSDLTYGGNYGIPSSIPFGSTEGTEDASKTWLAIRLKINDYSAAYGKTMSAFRLLMRLYDPNDTDGDPIYRENTLKRADDAVRWLDLKDGSMTWFYADSGVYKGSSNNGAGNIEFTGNMDGYLMIPINRTDVTLDELRNNFAGFRFILAEGTTIGNITTKESSWDDKEFLIGDSFLVSNAEDFQSDVIAANGIKKYALNNGEDTAYQAIRIGGYRSRYYALGSSSTSKSTFFSKDQYNPDVATTESSQLGLVHVTTLPNGDRALEFSVNKSTTDPNAFMTYSGSSYYIGMPSWDTYDHVRDGRKLTSTGTSAFYRSPQGKGVPDDIDFDKVNYMAFRIAVSGTGTIDVGGDVEKGTHHVSFALGVDHPTNANYSASKNVDLGSSKSYKFIDVNTGDCYNLQCDSTGIKIPGDVDGYIIIPIENFSGVTKDILKEQFGRYPFEDRAGTRIYLKKSSSYDGWDDGAKFYFGGAVWVEDATKFQKFHCPHVDMQAGTEVTATCQNEGYTPYTCKDCGFVDIRNKQDILPCNTDIPLGAHDATCTIPGFDSGAKCSWCGEITQMVNPTALLPHDRNLPCEKIPATCMETGTEAGIRCSMCNQPQEGCEEIPLKEHDKITIVAEEPATCKKTGTTEGRACSMCGEIQEGCTELPIVPCNSLKKVDAIPATCQEGGMSEGRRCTWCDTLQSGYEPTDPIPCDKNIPVSAVPTSCSKSGTTAGKKCSMCGAISEGCTEIAMREHTFVKIGYTAPTETTKGHDDYQCTECNYVEPRNWVPKLKAEGEAEEDDEYEENIGDDTQNDSQDNIDDEDDNDTENNIEDDEGNNAGQDGSEHSPITGENAIFLVIMIVLCLGAAAVLFVTKKRANK